MNASVIIALAGLATTAFVGLGTTWLASQLQQQRERRQALKTKQLEIYLDLHRFLLAHGQHLERVVSNPYGTTQIETDIDPNDLEVRIRLLCPDSVYVAWAEYHRGVVRFLRGLAGEWDGGDGKAFRERLRDDSPVVINFSKAERNLALVSRRDARR